MITEAIHMDQPISGTYEERIFDKESSWNSSEWTWIRFLEDSKYWCGEFRGKYIGHTVSQKIGIAIILTSDYGYVLDVSSSEIIDSFNNHANYNGIILTTDENILVTNGYEIIRFTDKTMMKHERLILNKGLDGIVFLEMKDNVLKISAYDYTDSNKDWEIIYIDCNNAEWIGY